jgi:hypothetical protein
LLHPQLAKLISLDEALLGELANRARLPFAVSTEKGLHIVPGDLAAWLGARRRGVAMRTRVEPSSAGLPVCRCRVIPTP